MVNDPTIERENIGGNQPMGDPAETDPDAGGSGIEETPDEPLTEGLPRERSTE